MRRIDSLPDIYGQPDEQNDKEYRPDIECRIASECAWGLGSGLNGGSGWSGEKVFSYAQKKTSPLEGRGRLLE